MKDCMLIGLALGFVAGAIFVQGNKRAQDLVQQGKDAVGKKMEEVAKTLERE